MNEVVLQEFVEKDTLAQQQFEVAQVNIEAFEAELTRSE
jgi:hypothetical protein